MSAEQTMLIKIGTKSLMHDGRLSATNFNQVAAQVHALRNHQIAIVSSGGIQAGKEYLRDHGRYTWQAYNNYQLAAFGAMTLVELWHNSFWQIGRLVAQTYFSHSDLDTVSCIRHIKMMLEGFFKNGDIAIINNNDAANARAVTEMMEGRGENDELTADLTEAIRPDAVAFISDCGGIWDQDPGMPGAKIIPELSFLDYQRLADSGHLEAGSNVGSGGPAKKLESAFRCHNAGARVGIIPLDGIIAFADGKNPGTLIC